MIRAEVRLADDAGLHARPVALLVRAARGFRSRVTLRAGDVNADGREAMQLLLLAAKRGATVEIEVEGPDEEQCLPVLAAILARAPALEARERTAARGRAYLPVGGAPTDATDIEGALTRVRADLRAERALVARDSGDDLAGILDAQETLLDEIAAALRAGATLERAGTEIASRLSASASAAVRAKAEDVRELQGRLQRALEGREAALPRAPGPWVYVAPRLETAVVAVARRHGIVGFWTAAAEPTAHAFILARGIGLPVQVVSAPDFAAVRPGDEIEVVGATARRAAPPPPGAARRVPVRANVSTPEEAIEAFALGADGIGLVRTELLFAGALAPPTAEDQRAIYAALLLPFGKEHPVTFRLFDGGGDKNVPFLPGPPDLRGIARLLRHPAVLGDQVAALERVGGAARLLVPFVERAEELVSIPRRLPVGAMIESTQGVREAAAIAERADFLCIGTNDLVASVLGRPRAETTATDALAAPVREAVAAIVAAAQRLGREVTVCGEAAALPAAIDAFLDVGVTALSVAPAVWAGVAQHVEAE